MRKRIDLIVLLVSLLSFFVVWKWGITASPAIIKSDSFWNIILGAGIVFSFVIYAMVYGLSSAEVRAEKIAREMTKDLAKYKLALDSTYNHVVITDPEGTVVYANKSVTELTGYSQSEVIGNNPRLWGKQMPEEVYKAMWKQIKDEKKVYRGEITNKRKNGELYMAKATISPIVDIDNQLLGFVGIEEDVTEDRAKSSEFERMVNERTGELMAVMNSMKRGLLVVNQAGKVILKNKSIKEQLMMDEEFDLLTLSSKLGEEVSCEAMVAKSFADHSDQEIGPVNFQNKYLLVTTVPIKDEGLVKEVAIFIDDVTESTNLQRARDEFFSIASHELRTPLTAIRGNAEMMLEQYGPKLNDATLVEMITDMHTGSVRLIEIVNDFLNVSRLEMGKIEFKNEIIKIDEVLASITQELTLDDKETVPIVYAPPSLPLPQVSGDIDRLKQVLINLIGNARKFTKTGTITLRPSLHGDMVWVEIIDTGAGIDPQQQGLLFRKFQQAGDSIYTRDTSKGTGLGLYISKLLMRGMGGDVWLVQSQVGSGSTFALSLKLV